MQKAPNLGRLKKDLENKLHLKILKLIVEIPKA